MPLECQPTVRLSGLRCRPRLRRVLPFGGAPVVNVCLGAESNQRAAQIPQAPQIGNLIMGVIPGRTQTGGKVRECPVALAPTAARRPALTLRQSFLCRSSFHLSHAWQSARLPAGRAFHVTTVRIYTSLKTGDYLQLGERQQTPRLFIFRLSRTQNATCQKKTLRDSKVTIFFCFKLIM